MISIRSGAQTGVDRAALDAAMELGLSSCGWVPRGRLDENGRIPDRYPGLAETPSSDPGERTELNVRDSDATLLISRGPLSGGSAYTQEMAGRHRKPFLHLDFALLSFDDALAIATGWLGRVRPAVLNVAGPRASEDPGVYGPARELLLALFGE